MANKRNSELHKGHRQRLKERALKYGLDSLSEHEKLELILFYTVPRKDVNEPSHILLNTFGSFYNICNSNMKDIVRVNGIGDEAAIFFQLFPQICEWYYKSKDKGKIKLSNAGQCVKYFRTMYELHDYEEAYVGMLNEKEELIKIIPIGIGENYKVEINENLLSYEINLTQPKYVVLFHTHPKGKVKPSFDDLVATVRIIKTCKLTKSTLVEHIIINQDSYYSFKDEGIIQELKSLAEQQETLFNLNDQNSYSKILKNI